MSFVSPLYPALLTLIVLIHRLLPAEYRGRWLILSSAAIYGWYLPSSLLILLLIASSDYAIALACLSDRRFRWLSVAKNTGALAWFLHVAPSLGLPSVLPLGFAFYAMQSTGYVLEVAEGRIAARRHLSSVLLFVSFFPQLVAGPIERASDLLPQLDAARVASARDLRRGLMLLVWGAFQKLVVADSIAPWVDRAFAASEPGGAMIWGATVAFMVQIYADVSGYTDLARGSALLLGVELSKNFDAPWRAATTPEFWSRWHRTVARFAREHLLAPLLGEQPSPSRRALAVLVTLAALGAWHGPGWHFLVFGLLHGASFSVSLALGPPRARLRPLLAALHLALVGLPGALIFREPDVARLIAHFARPPWISSGDERLAGVALVGMAALLALPLVAGQEIAERWPARARSPWALPAEIALGSLLLAATWVLWRPADADFLYFRF